MLLRAAASRDAFLRAPWGTYIAGASWLIFSAPSQRFSGLVLWGAPTDVDMGELMEVVAGHGAHPPHPSLVDTRHLARVDPQAFTALGNGLVTHLAAIRGAVARIAILHGDGLAGAIAAGFASSQQLAMPISVFRDPVEALAWLGPAARREVVVEVDELVRRLRESAPLVARIAVVLEGQPAASLAAVARKLALSSRSLQRKLAEAGTSFSREVDAARARVALRILDEHRKSPHEAAYAVGLRSPASLAELLARAKR